MTEKTNESKNPPKCANTGGNGNDNDPSSALNISKKIKELLCQKSTINLPESVDAHRLDDLRRLFANLITSNEFNPNTNITTYTSSTNSAQEKWNSWLKKQHLTFLTQLTQRVQSGRKSALRTFMGVIASTPYPILLSTTKSQGSTSNTALNHHTNYYRIHDYLITQLVQALIEPTNNDNGILSEQMLELLENEFIAPYRDVQYFMMMSIKQLSTTLYQRLLNIQRRTSTSTTRNNTSLNHSVDQNNTNDNDNDELEENESSEQLNQQESYKIGIMAENLMRILIRIEIATSQDDLTPLNVQERNGRGGGGTCSNYLFLPPPTRENHPHNDDGDNDDESNNDDEYDEDDDETSSSSDNESNDESNHPSKKRKISSATISTTTTKDKVYSWQSITKHRSALQQSHLALLKINVLPPRSLKRILTHLPINVLPHISSPLRFADFCTSAYEMGGLTSIHALHSLFILMTEHGLEYKAFYESLYNVVSIRMFYVKYRIRFFKLLIQCLCGNSMLPTYLIAAFCKKLLRCCINGPPSGILFVVALVSNLIRKHKEVACIIHRIPSSDQTMDDPYAEGEKDPSKSRAIESSLWELNALEHHYHPAVRLLAKECGKEDEKTLLHDLDGFLLHTYKSLFEQERKREMTKKRSGSTVPLTFKEPKGLFVKEDIFDGIADFPQHE